MQIIKRGDIFFSRLPGAEGSEQKGTRPVIVIQNNIGNAHSETLIVIPITSMRKRYLPTHIMIGTDYGIERESTALAEQIMTIDKSRLVRYVGSVDKRKMDEIDEALKISLDLSE